MKKNRKIWRWRPIGGWRGSNSFLGGENFVAGMLSDPNQIYCWVALHGQLAFDLTWTKIGFPPKIFWIFKQKKVEN